MTAAQEPTSSLSPSEHLRHVLKMDLPDSRVMRSTKRDESDAAETSAALVAVHTKSIFAACMAPSILPVTGCVSGECDRPPSLYWYYLTHDYKHVHLHWWRDADQAELVWARCAHDFVRPSRPLTVFAREEPPAVKAADLRRAVHCLKVAADFAFVCMNPDGHGLNSALSAYLVRNGMPWDAIPPCVSEFDMSVQAASEPW